MLMKGWQGTREEWDVSEEIYKNANLELKVQSTKNTCHLLID